MCVLARVPFTRNCATNHRFMGSDGATWFRHISGGVASMTACVFTNPIDVVKTRMQLQVGVAV